MNANSYDNPGTTGGNKEEFLEGLTILEPEDTPFVATTSKTGGAKSTFTEVVADTLRAARTTGTREGAPAQGVGNKATNRQRFGNYQHRVFDEYSVTDVQEDVSRAGGTHAVADELAYAAAKTMREIKRDMEAICCGNQEMQGGSSAEMQTRGYFKWVQSGEQSTQAVPAEFRPASEAIIDVDNNPTDDLLEADFQTALSEMVKVYGVSRNFDFICGNDFTTDIDNFTTKEGTAQASRYSVIQNKSEHEIDLMVSVVSTSFGKVQVIPSQFVNINSSGVGNATAGIFRNPELWELHFLEEPTSKEKEDDGGGQSGWIRAKFASMCRQPAGNAAIYYSSLNS